MKRKVNINRPKISSEEITQRKDFDSVLKNHATLSTKPLLKKPWFLSSVIVATLAVIVTVAVLNHHTETKEVSSIKMQDPTTNNELEFYRKEEAKPCISPPLKDVNVPYTLFKVIAEKGADLKFKTGSKLQVPKNAFVDETGKQVKGEVELRYREFHDPFEVFVSGIPMTYDSAGVKYQFESAGMMEMLAFQNGKVVHLAPQKSINVELASEQKGSEYNLYKLDTTKNNWSCLGKDKVVDKGADAGKKDPNNNAGSDQEKITVQQIEYRALETKKSEIKQEKETQIATLPKPGPEPKKPVQARKEKYTFNLEVDPKEYPELAVYKGLLFEVGDENKGFTKALYDITWDEAVIKEGQKKGVNYLMTLKKAAKKYEFIVYPVLEGKNYETALKSYQDKFSKYNSVLEKRVADEKRIEEEYQAKLVKLQKEQEALIAEEKRKMDERMKSMSTEEKVMRMFAISSFGVYNCDNPSAYPRGENVNVNLTNDKNAKLLCYNIYLVDKAKFGLFTFYKNPVASFSFNPKSKNMIWTVEDGVMYWLKPEQFQDIETSNGMCNLKMNRVDQKFTSVDEMKAYFNF